MPLIAADVAEVMRSGQKDDEITKTKLHHMAIRAITSFGNLCDVWRQRRSSSAATTTSTTRSSSLQDDVGENPTFLQAASTSLLVWGSELDVAVNLMYYLVTTVSRQQTIGEEYVNIVQVDGTYRYHPRLPQRSAMVALHCMGPYIYQKFTDYLMKYINANSWMAESKKPLVRDLLNCSTALLQWLYRLQRSLFFLQLSSENISKHITSTNYVTIRRTPVAHTRWFTLLGLFGVIQSAVSFVQALSFIHRRVRSLSSKKTSPQTISSQSRAKCPLCYDPYQEITSTPCGHLFCWGCIYPWASSTPRCPICRLDCEPGKLVLLINFAA